MLCFVFTLHRYAVLCSVLFPPLPVLHRCVLFPCHVLHHNVLLCCFILSTCRSSSFCSVCSALFPPHSILHHCFLLCSFHIPFFMYTTFMTTVIMFCILTNIPALCRLYSKGVVGRQLSHTCVKGRQNTSFIGRTSKRITKVGRASREEGPSRQQKH